jgi:hypothetical protein
MQSEGLNKMKYQFQVAIAVLVLAVMSLLPASAYAMRGTDAQTYHNRTPRARTPGTHPHHG